MPTKYDIGWLENFEGYKRFVSEEGKAPSPYAFHPAERKLGVWLHNQVRAYRSGSLTPDRLSMMNSFNPLWCEGRSAEFREEKKRLLIDSPWQRKVPAGELPIDAALEGDDLYYCLKREWYSCEAFFRNGDFKGKPAGAGVKVFQALFPDLDYHCVQLLRDVKRDASQDNGLGFAQELSANSAYVSAKDMRHKVWSVLSSLDYKEQTTLAWRYGLLDGRKHVFSEIALSFDVTPERVRQIEFEALRELRKPSRSHYLFSGEAAGNTQRSLDEVLQSAQERSERSGPDAVSKSRAEQQL